MKSKLIHFLRYKPFFLVLLPAFFVLHGLKENYGVVPVPVAWLLFGTYVAAALFLTGLAWIAYRNWMKAALFASCLMAFHFFFGAVHDLLRDWFPGQLVTRHVFILPFSFLLIITVAFLIRKRKSGFTGTTYFSNILLLLLILIDIGGLLLTMQQNNKQQGAVSTDKWIRCDSCRKPDVYLIITDGYPGKTELNELLEYDNQVFEDSLRRLGFYITDSSMSNYNFTTYSMASMLNMEYLDNIVGRYHDKNDLAYCYGRIRDNRVAGFFKQNGYRVYNHSIFDLEDLPSSAIPTFLPRKAEPITSQTFLSRMEKELAYHFATTFKLGFVVNFIKTNDLINNRKLMKETRETVMRRDGQPKFVYTHLVMPHRPYYFDSTGAPLPLDTLTEEFGKNIPAFISYLKYCNRELLHLVNDIRAQSPNPPLILLMSDHGFREFSNPVENRYQFYTLNALLLPDSAATGHYKGMTNVNQFRILLNTQFGQRLPLLKDSTSYLID